ncbi:MAG: ABC transporter permease [Candidatus Heimdallarchaeota archaeon]|nr:ABC transporter permease [Candidatus Heimdallarchaeota archaeon]MBY8993965.1 ABC transporter permease [Candidatus Heimdallarchaeota archaeon]
MNAKFYFTTALKNITNGKKQSVLFILGIFLSVSLLISLRLWSSTAEDLAARDFLTDQDFEMKVTTYMPEEIPFILDWLNNDPIVQKTYELYYNLACFNAEEKDPDYIFDPQEDPDDPISITALGLWPQDSLNRIESQFSVRGSFDLQLGEVLISEYEAKEIEGIMGYPIEPGMKINVSIARRSPELGEVRLFQMELRHFENVTVKGIYRPIPTISMLQKTFSASFLRDSVIFLRENIIDSDILQMRANGIEPAIMVKTKIDELKKNGIGEILNILEDLADRLKITYQSSQFVILDTPTLDLQQSYSLAQTAIVFMVPVIAASVILTLFTTNIVIEKRKEQLYTIKDRGGQNWQIIGLILLEFLILTLVGIILSIVCSFVIASLIPSIASGSFSGAVFREFITKVEFPYTLTLYITVSVLVVSSLFVLLKLRLVLQNNLEDKQRQTRERIQKLATIIIVGGLFILTLIFLIYNTIQNHKNTSDIFNFTIYQTQQSMMIFLSLILLILLLAIVATLFSNNILGKLKWLYDRFFLNKSFFISNSLKSSKNKLSTILIILIIISCFNVFTLNIYSTIRANEQAEYYYKNGADLRIHTSYVESSYTTNISSIDGIGEIMPVLKTEGKLIYNRVTVYGIDPIIYSRIGRWNSVYTSPDEVTNMMRSLNQTDNGVIISDYVSNRLNLTLGSTFTIADLPYGNAYESFEVRGVIHSAPGLGLAYGINIELNQPNQEFLLINERTLRNNYLVTDTNLFFAKLKPDAEIESVIEDTLNLENVINVNPEIVNEQFVGKYINNYIPDVKTFLLIQIMLMNIVGFIIIGTNIEFILKQRDQSNAILNSIGNSNKNLIQTVFAELMVVEITSIIIAFIVALPLSVYSIYFNRPIFTNHNILPYIFKFDVIGIPIFIIAMLAISLLVTLPSLVRFAKQNISLMLRK